MIIVEDRKAVVLHLKSPKRVLDVIPTARSFDWKGRNLVAVPHREDEAVVLNNMGIDVPMPIMNYYDWPGRYEPYHHQMETSAFLTRHRRCLVLNQIGTGKSLSAIWAADHMMNEGYVKKALILSPLSTLETVWGDEIFFALPHRTHAILHGTAGKRMDLLRENHDFAICNHDGFNIIMNEARGMFDLLIVDEAAVYRNTQTNRFRHLMKWLNDHPSIRLWLMTGTPTPNAPTDAYALGRILRNPYTDMSFNRFQRRTMYKVTQFKWVPRPEATEIVKLALTPSIRYSRDECFDLPETVVETREAKLSGEQLKVYNNMLKKFVAEASGSQITAHNEAIKISKLLQIACGVAYDDESERVVMDCTPRIKLISEIIEQSGEKVIVFAPYRGVLSMLEDELSKKWSVASVHGNVSSKKRAKIFRDFQQKSDPRILIAHPGTMAHGLTLTEASTIIWYGPMYSNETYQQANGRIERIGKTKRSMVVHIEGTELEKKVYARLQGRQKLQGLLLDLVRDDKYLTT